MSSTPTSQPSTVMPGLTPFYKDDLVLIYQGEAQEVLPDLDLHDEPVVHVVTDPPYGIGLAYGEIVDQWRPDFTFWRLLHDSLPTQASLHMTVSNRHFDYWLTEVCLGGWQYLHTSVYWNKNRAGGNWGGQFAYAWEPLVSFSKGPKAFSLGQRMLSDVFDHSGKRKTDHPAERDINAWYAFMQHLPPGLILDPFLGSGTTLRSALDLDRAAIGIEREANWCEQAALRCAQQLLFVP